MPRPSFLDHTGAVVKPGDRVRIVAVPDVTGMRSPHHEEAASVFAHIKGTVKRVHEIDDHGNAVLVFFIRSGKHAGYHSVGIEGEHVRKSRHRGT
jgi:hypothetical protein